MRHLDDWCKTSRMRFGAEKSQIVIFTTRKTVDPTPFNNLQLCGFTVDVVSDYKYLGVYLTTRLSWTRALAHALQKAKKSCNLVTRVALAARTLTFAAVRSLVLGLVIPSFSYGLLFWGRSIDLNAADVTSLQAQVATPLRVALTLPRTTHQLGTLMLCDVPTVSSLVLRAQLTHLARVCGPRPLPLSHPTRRLHAASIALFTQRARPQMSHNARTPSAALPLSPYLAACVLPRTLLDPSLGARLDPASLHSLQLTALPNWENGVKYWENKSEKRREWASENYLPNHLVSAILWSLMTAARLTYPIISKLCALFRHAEWTATHAPIAPPPGSDPIPHATTAPLTLCLPSAGLPPFLARRTTDTHPQQARRSRLLLGRSRTGTVRKRFAKVAEAPAISATCTLCSTPTNPVDDSIPHMLLQCTRHRDARAQLLSASTALGLPPPLTLSSILLASPPPPPFRHHNLPQLLRATTSFLTAIHVDRSKEQLVPLDTG
jgi:hypothetical protein